MSRLGLYGGTFDPVHYGHLRPAQVACDALGLDRLVFIPAARPPHKLDEPLSPFCHRFAMLALATQEREEWLVSDVELRRSGPTYTIDTLAELTAAMPAKETFFLMGSDSFVQLTTWHRWAELVERVHLAVLHRAGAWGEELAAAVPDSLASRIEVLRQGQRLQGAPTGKRIFVLEHEPVPVSATALRAALRHGVHPSGMLPPEVERHALKYHLYGQGEAHADGL